MSFYSFSRTGLKFTLIAVSTLAVGLAFQNCSTQFSSDSPEVQASLNTPNRVSDDSDGTDPSLDASELKIELYATTALQEDCSVSGENYQFEILNVSQDITMCMEYALDMPEGHPRRQESYKCNDINSDDKYVPPSSGWEYSATERKWSYQALANTVEQMPGDYRLYVRSGSSLAKSALLKVRRSGYANCGSQTARYVVPTPPPSSGGGGVVLPTPSPGSVAPGANGACNPPGTTIVHMGPLNGKNLETGQVIKNWWPRTTYRPSNKEVYVWSYRVTSNELSKLVNGISYNLNRVTGALVPVVGLGRLDHPGLVVSTCPGDTRSYLHTGGSDLEKFCSSIGMEYAGVDITVSDLPEKLYNDVYKNKLYACHLKTNTTYYINAFAVNTSATLQNGKAIPANSCDPYCAFSFDAR